jgi:hypothetical protein
MNGNMIDKIVNGNYKNLGLVIDATVVENQAFAYSSWFKSDYIWCRYIMLTNSVDVKHDIFVMRKTPEGVADWGSVIVNDASSTSNSWGTIIIPTTTGGLLGYEFRFGIKNDSGAASTTRCKLSVQLFSA